MSCTLCNSKVVTTQTMRPNCATFSCGHTFHLSCVIQHSKEKMTNACPICVTDVKSNVFANFGDDRIKALNVLIERRRKLNKIDTPKSFLGNIFSTKKDLISMVNGGTSLRTLKIQGYIPENFVEERIMFQEVSKVYKMSAMLDFGFEFNHFLTMGIRPEHFKLMDYNQMQELRVTAADMLRTSIDIYQLSELNLDLYKLREMGWKWTDVCGIGGDVKTIRELTANMSDIKTYLEPDDWEKAGFNEDSIKKYEYNQDFNPFKKKVSITKKRQMRKGMVF